MKTIAAAALMILAMTARAKEGETTGKFFLNGNALYAMCTSATEMGRMECLNYVEGIFDAGAEEGIFNDEHWPGPHSTIANLRWCHPSGIEAGQVVDVVTKFLRDSPQRRHWSAANLVARAMADAWPCTR